MPEKLLAGREVIFELQSIGQYVKITAMDTATMTEIVIQGPASASEAVLKANAARKLEYMLRKKGLI
jgi:hypothetical protein